MQKYQGECECGFATKRYAERARAERALTKHVCPPRQEARCQSCAGLFWALVDDVLCVRCDALMFPAGPVLVPVPVFVPVAA